MIKAVVGYEHNGTVYPSKKTAAKAKYQEQIDKLFFPPSPHFYLQYACEKKITPQMIIDKADVLFQIIIDFQLESAE